MMATGNFSAKLSLQDIKQLFSQFDTRFNSRNQLRIPSTASLKAASVLIPLFYKNSELHVLLTVRHRDMPSHAGHVAFPGGMWQDGDDGPVATALREANEEVGIRPEEVDIIAVLPASLVKPNSLVTPVVGLIQDGFNLKINQQEVEQVFDLPLKRFLSTENRTHRDFVYEGINFEVYHFKDVINGCEVDTWGFTAMQCIQVAMVTFQSDLKISFYGDIVITRHNCFDKTLTEAILDRMLFESKL